MDQDQLHLIALTMEGDQMLEVVEVEVLVEAVVLVPVLMVTFILKANQTRTKICFNWKTFKVITFIPIDKVAGIMFRW